MKILLTGGAGYIGSHVLLSIIENKHEVIVIDDLSTGNKNLIPKNIKLINTNINNSEKISNLLVEENFDLLLHFAGFIQVEESVQNPDKYFKNNTDNAIELFETCYKHNLQNIIFSSTAAAYGNPSNNESITEDETLTPLNPYGESKVKTEEYLLNNYNTLSWILRFAPVYAPDFQLNINRRTKAAGRYYKVRKGSKKLSLCNLENIGSVVQDILKEKVPAGVYNISDENEYSYNDLLKYVNAKWIVRIPTFLVKGLYVVGKMMNNIFLKENATKLISDNIFSSDKIRQYISLPASLNE